MSVVSGTPADFREYFGDRGQVEIELSNGVEQDGPVVQLECWAPSHRPFVHVRTNIRSGSTHLVAVSHLAVSHLVAVSHLCLSPGLCWIDTPDDGRVSTPRHDCVVVIGHEVGATERCRQHTRSHTSRTVVITSVHGSLAIGRIAASHTYCHPTRQLMHSATAGAELHSVDYTVSYTTIGAKTGRVHRARGTRFTFP